MRVLYTPTTRRFHCCAIPLCPSHPTPIPFLPTAPILTFFLFPVLPPSRHFVDWVQDMAAATTKWGAISDWDVSGVGDFSYAFSADNAKVF